MGRGTVRFFLCAAGVGLILTAGGCGDFNQYDVVRDASVPAMTEEAVHRQDSETTEGTERSAQTPQDAGFLEEGCSFAYESLNEAEQLWYRNIAECLGGMACEISLDRQGIEQGMDETDIDKIFQCVLTDHPELFYVEGYSYTKYNRQEEIISIRFSGNYNMDKEQAEKRRTEIQTAAASIIAVGTNLEGDYDKVKYVYETIIENTEYDLDSPDNQNIYSVFVNHRSVCQGYAKAVQYLLNRMGVECVLVQGTVDTGESHAWNLVKVNGSFYYVDATWGDASYQPQGQEVGLENVPKINYDYLCITTNQLMRTHILDSYVPMPPCVDMKDNYYVREGAMFASYDKEQMAALFEKAFLENRGEITVKCADSECFWQIFKVLTEEQEIFDYLEAENETVVYTHNEKQLSMTFWVTKP